MHLLKKSLILAFSVLISLQFSWGQEIAYDLDSFSKIIVSPKINLILEQGDRESIRLTYSNVSANKINIKVHGKTLRIYLDDAKLTEKTERINPHGHRGIYRDASITAYVTYKDLERLEIRGSQELICNGPIHAEKFILKAYGENEISLSSVETAYLKTSLYGENKLKIKGGRAEFQRYKLFGENRIDTKELKSYAAATTSYGESSIKLTTRDNLRVNAFGESRISYQGNANINRGLIFGHTHINRMN